MTAALLPLAKSLVARVLGREIVLLPLEPSGAGSGGQAVGELLPVQYCYRASPDGVVTYRMLSSGLDCAYELWTATHTSAFRPVRSELRLSCAIPRIVQGDELQVSLVSPRIWLNGRSIEITASPAAQSRKYVAAVR